MTEDAETTPATIRTVVPPVDRLMESADSFARSALAAYRDEVWAVFYLHLGAALEHLVKAALVHANPTFIADPAGGFDPLLHLAGLGHRARVPEFVTAVKTITLSEALKRIARLIDDYQAHDPLIDTLMSRRNGVAHIGTTVRGQEADILGEVGRYVPQILAYVGRTAADLWGEGEPLVGELANRRLTESEASYRRRVEAAKRRYQAWAAVLEPEALNAVLQMLEPTEHSDDFREFPIECPACGRLGRLHGEPEANWLPDWDVADGEGYVAGAYVGSITLHVSLFECPVCRLTLVDELEVARLHRVTFRDFNAELAAEYFRDEEEYDDYWDDR